MKWLRLYHEARNDAKLEYLADDEFRVWFRLLCFAGEQPTRGYIEGFTEELLAVEVAKGNIELLVQTLEKLKKLKIIVVDESIKFVNWDKRQFYSDNVTERVRRYRETLHKRCSNDDETPPDTDTDTDTENKYPADHKAMVLANYLKEWILKNNPNAKAPTTLNQWALEIDRMMRIDSRSAEEIRAIIDYSQRHSFWWRNILSADKLRKQFDRLHNEMTSDSKTNRRVADVNVE